VKANPMSLASFDFQELVKGWDIRLSPRFWSYRPNFEVEIETSQYILKTATSMDDLLEVFQLRYKIFLEHTESGSKGDGFDLDQFDDLCDHIIIIDKLSDKVCGTYRVLSSLTAKSFYSETEFRLDNFLASSGVKMELGRACIDYGHRNGAVIDLLWKGIARYVKLMNASYMFGCSSVKSTDLRVAKTLYLSMAEEGVHTDRFSIRSYGDFEVCLDEVESLSIDEVDSKRLLPPLLRSYFSAGAKVYGVPALDRDFECFDFLTILDVNELTPGFKRRYFNA
jgi:putative hemolysin